jgi:hypothetical protein
MIDLEFVQMTAVPLFVGLAVLIGYEYIKHFVPNAKPSRRKPRPYIHRVY